jgi:hypothetical protein
MLHLAQPPSERLNAVIDMQGGGLSVAQSFLQGVEARGIKKREILAS